MVVGTFIFDLIFCTILDIFPLFGSEARAADQPQLDAMVLLIVLSTSSVGDHDSCILPPEYDLERSAAE
jgi:hypothetical protein